MSDFEWTDVKVKMFCNVYSTNFQSKLIDESIFKYRNYAGKKIDEKIEQFKEDCKHIKFPLEDKNKKEFTLGEVLAKYKMLSEGNKNNVLYEALDFMHQYNGRSKTDCIALAMGYEIIDDENNIYLKK